MNLRSGGKVNAVVVAMGVGAAELMSMLYFMFTPWFLSPGDRSLYTSVACNIVLFLVIKTISEKYWYIRSPKDAVLLSLGVTVTYICIQGPYLITWYNPLSYMNLLGPALHTHIIVDAMGGVLLYLKNK